MELPRNGFKAALAQKRRIFGTWLMMDNPVTAEALSYAGFDFLVIDMEHSATDVREARTQLQAIQGGGAAAVVRLPASEPVVAKKVLDLGAQTLMFPMIQTAEDARRAVASTRYAPEGIRGMAVMHRASRYTTVDGYLEKAAGELCVTVQIETAEAVANAAAIAAVQGVDGLFVGPGDLSASLGLIGQVSHAKVVENVERVLDAAHRAGKPAGILAANEDLGEKYATMGFDFVAVASDMAFLMRAARAALGRMRG
ncbi:MAG TPA: aldolase/citrate lyase family protein [Usitatibacter sp.]|nr:aldolase/citrate lyase family protein [Usitatibacter sp.]